MYERTVMTDRPKTTTQGETGRSALATVRVRRVCLRSRKDTLRRNTAREKQDRHRVVSRSIRLRTSSVFRRSRVDRTPGHGSGRCTPQLVETSNIGLTCRAHLWGHRDVCWPKLARGQLGSCLWLLKATGKQRSNRDHNRRSLTEINDSERSAQCDDPGNDNVTRPSHRPSHHHVDIVNNCGDFTCDRYGCPGTATGVRPDCSSIHRKYDLTADNPRNDGCSACNRRDRASSVNDDSGCSFATPDHLARANNNQRGAHPDRSSTWTIVRAATVDWPHRIGADRCVFGEGL